MPFLVGLKSEIHLVPVLFMTSLTGYGILKRTICLLISILWKPRLKSQKTRGRKRNLWKRSQLQNCFPSLKTPLFPLKDSLTIPCFRSIKSSFLTCPFRKGLSAGDPYLQQATGLLLLPRTGCALTASVTVPQKESLTVTVTATFPSLTAISDGILPENAGITDTVCTCSLHLIPKATFPFSLYWTLLPGTIPLAF